MSDLLMALAAISTVSLFVLAAVGVDWRLEARSDRAWRRKAAAMSVRYPGVISRYPSAAPRPDREGGRDARV